MKIDLNWQIYQDTFLELLMESMVTAEATIEQEYISLVLSIDNSRHPILQKLKANYLGLLSDKQLSRDSFFGERVGMIECTCYFSSPLLC